jgi:hypothetical protein
VRLVRCGAEASQVGADVRAALSSWGPADSVLGGIALLGVTPVGGPGPVEAVLVLPKGVVVVVGVDLPDPALRLDAPLNAQWRADGWPLVRGDGAVNPAEEALNAAKAVTTALQTRSLAPIPVSTIVAVGPYVGQVVQSTGDLHQDVRVLHPDPKSMLTATRELAHADRPCSVEQARTLIAELLGREVPMLVGEVAAEGFADEVTADLASASTTILPKITDQTALSGKRRGALVKWPGRRAVPPGRQRWVSLAALGLIGGLLITAIAIAFGSGGGTAPARAADRPAAPPVTVGGVRFQPEASAVATDCASHAYGDTQVWLTGHVCTRLVRSVYETEAAGRQAAVAVAVLTFADQPTAAAFADVANTPGSGGITDLVKDGHGWAGGPRSFDDAAYSVTVRDTLVRLTEVVWSSGPSDPGDAVLHRLAATSAGLPGNQ